MGMHIVVAGNPADGFRYYGPFTTGEEGVERASENLDDYWWTAPLQEPTKELNV